MAPLLGDRQCLVFGGNEASSVEMPSGALEGHFRVPRVSAQDVRSVIILPLFLELASERHGGIRPLPRVPIETTTQSLQTNPRQRAVRQLESELTR